MNIKDIAYLAQSSAQRQTVKVNETATTIEGLIATALTRFIIPTGIALAVGFVIYGGVLYIMSSGDPEKTSKAKKTILWAVASTILMVLAIPIVEMIIRETGVIITDP